MKARLIPKLAVFSALVAGILACSLNLSNQNDKDLERLETSIAIQQTELAAQSTKVSEAQAALAQAEQTAVAQPAEPDYAATSYAMSVEATAAVLNQPAPIMLQSPVPPTQAPPMQATQAPPPSNNTGGPEFKEWMKTANIVVFEDMVVNDAYALYVKDTLKSMGLRFKWDGNAMGWFKTDLLSGANGKPWDLVIIAAEARDQVSGEYFDYLSNVLNNGTPLIMESWYLEDISEGKVAPLLAKCGLQVYPYVPKTRTVNDVVMYALPPANSPLLTDPNTTMAFTKAMDTWIWSFDLGTKMALTGTGDGQLLIGTNAQESYRDGTLAVCMDGQVTIQGFSSHSFPYRVVGPLWENYIVNALRWRYNHR